MKYFTSTKTNTIQRINDAIEEYEQPRKFLVYSPGTNKLYLVETEVQNDERDVHHIISDKLGGPYEIMEVSKDYEVGNLIELCKL